MPQFARVGRGLAALGALAALATLVQQWDTRREVQLLGTGTGTGAPPSRAPPLVIGHSPRPLALGLAERAIGDNGAACRVCRGVVRCAGRPVLRDLALDAPPPRQAAVTLPIERRRSDGVVVSGAPRRHYTNTWQMGTRRVFPPARGRRGGDMHRHSPASAAAPASLFFGQQQVNLDENDKQKRYWAAAGVRGAALGEVPAAQVGSCSAPAGRNRLRSRVAPAARANAART